MSRFDRRSLWALVVALCVSPFARAEDAPAKGDKLAVIVGVGKFADKDIKPRETADADAKAVYDLLVNKDVGGYSPDRVSLLLSGNDEKRNAKAGTKANILKAIKNASEKANKDDQLFIYLVMQGATAGEKPCLFAVDSTFKDRQKDGIFAGDIEELVKGLKSEKVIVFSDFYMKAFESKEAVLAPNVFEYVRVFLGLKEKDPDQEPPTGRGVYLMGNGIQTPITVGSNGIFTKGVLDALSGKADKDGYEPDGIVTTDELKSYLDKHVTELSKGLVKATEERFQRVGYSGRPIHFTLTRNPEAAVKATERLKKFDDLQKAAKLETDVVSEAHKILGQMPKLKAMQDLRKSYQKFTDGDLNAEQLLTARKRIQDSMILPEADAKAFSTKLYSGLSLIKKNYIKKLEMGDMVVNAIKGLYLRAEAPVPADLKDKFEKARNLSDAELLVLLREARLPLGKREDLDTNKDVEIGINAGIRKFVDDYTTYIEKEKVEEVDKEIDGNFTGIGVQIRRDIARDALLIVTPIRNSPGYKAGLLAGDLITEIIREEDSKGVKLNPPEIISTKGMETTDAVKVILGVPGTKVKLKIEREGTKEPIVKEITRGRVMVESVYGYKRNEKDDSWDFYIDPKSKIAYLYLTQFARNSAEDMKAAVQKLVKDGVKGVILDLRFNPGGYLDVAVDICDMFIDDGVIVSIRPGNSLANERIIPGRHKDSYLDFPMVCLINDGSASGSEILSACLQDHSRAVIMGERSYGKGSVQNVVRFPETDGKIKFTNATFWPPSGKNLNKPSTSGKEEEDWGVRPDKGFAVKLERAEKDELFEKVYNWGVIPRRDLPPKENAKEFKDRQLEKALEYLQGQLNANKGASGKPGG